MAIHLEMMKILKKLMRIAVSWSTKFWTELRWKLCIRNLLPALLFRGLKVASSGCAEEAPGILATRRSFITIMPPYTERYECTANWPLTGSVFYHSPYLTIPSPCDFFVLPKMTKNLKLLSFGGAWNSREKRFYKCITANRQYFKGDWRFFF